MDLEVATGNRHYRQAWTLGLLHGGGEAAARSALRGGAARGGWGRRGAAHSEVARQAGT